ncbi:MAG TPA: hypothetical protein VGM78_10570, partial [Ilumatobacteraceae bacterium]
AVTGAVPADIGLDAAIAVGRANASPDATLVYVSLPSADDDTSYYDMWFSERLDQYRYGAYPGQFEVNVDRHDATHVAVNDYGTAPTLSNKLLDRLGGPTFHYGQTVNGWWRIFWFVLGLTPLLLAVTGLSTWLYKRTLRKRRRGVLADPRTAIDVDRDEVVADAVGDTDAPIADTTVVSGPDGDLEVSTP